MCILSAGATMGGCAWCDQGASRSYHITATALCTCSLDEQKEVRILVKARGHVTRIAIALTLLSLSSWTTHARAHAQPVINCLLVVHDLTDQSACLLNVAPCPKGAVVVFNVSKVDRAMAMAQNRAYMSADVSREALLAWVNAQYVAAYPPAASGAGSPRPYLSCLPKTPQTDAFSEHLPDIHSDIQAAMIYNVSKTCVRQAIKLNQTWTGGPRPYQDGIIYVIDDYNNYYDDDGAGLSCIPLSHNATFHQYQITTTNTLYSAVQYSSGSACTYFGDTFDDVYYRWTQ